ncbi:MAG TPA: hypothetical protein PKA19_06215 [Bacillota bacterium]|nr:hypothetical protein [Bacillota bacterium]
MITKNDLTEQCITYSQMNLISNARIFYRRLAIWTRAYIISRYFGIGNAEELFGRFYLEALSAGDLLKIIFGRENAERYSQIVSQFAIIVRDLITAQLEGDTEGVARNVDRLFQNAETRSDFLASINPYWEGDRESEDLENFIGTLIEMANFLAAGDSSGDIALYGRLMDMANRIGDDLGQGLFNYIVPCPDKLEDPLCQCDEPCITYDQMNAIFGVRMFWFELATWIRSYMLSRYLGLENTEEVFERLKQVPVEYVSFLRQIFGDAVAENYVELFNQYIDLVAALITAQMEGNVDEINRITQLLYQNADQRAVFIAALNPQWSEEEWRARLYDNLRSTIDESTSFLTQDYARNIDIFSRILDQAESTSNYFEDVLFQFIIQNQQSR